VGSGRCRTYEEIEALFTGLEMVEPGLVRVIDWWPDGPPLKPPGDVLNIGYGAVARKP
jgi:S-adenosyl methyltransferase